VASTTSTTHKKNLEKEVLSKKSGKSAEIEDSLKQIYAEFEQISKNPTQTTLLELDTRIRKLILTIQELRNERPYGDLEFWKPKYEKLGLSVGRYESWFYYSGKILGQAHKLGPTSKFRNYTLFSEVERSSEIAGEDYIDPEELPNIEAAYKYSREFPNGPFAKDVYEIIADFHKDLYMIIRDYSIKNFEPDYKYDCYKQYIEHSPYSEQLERNKRIAIKYYSKVLKIEKNDKWATEFREAVANGTVSGWSNCPC